MTRTLRYAGLVAVATLWTTLGAGALLTGFDLGGERPLSHLGTQPGSAGLFTAGLVVAAVALVGFHAHVRARYPVPVTFSVAMLVGLAGQVVAALVSISGDGAGHRVHTTAALVLGASLPLLMWRFAAGQPTGGWRRLSYGLFWLEAAAVTLGLHLSARMVAPVAEILPAAGFHLWILVLTAGRRRVPGATVPATRIRPGGRHRYRQLSCRYCTRSTASDARSRHSRLALPRCCERRGRTSRTRCLGG